MSYYIKNTVLPIDEDDQWEFKAHRNFSSDEVPAWRPDGTKVCPSRAMSEFNKTKNIDRTRQPISRNLCGFLNSGKGGTILIGVLDSGTVVGLSLNKLQQDHLLLSLEDALRRFQPRVPRDFVRVSFKPVLENPSEFKYLAEQAHLCDPPKELRQQAHQLRTSSLCWCDVQAMQRFKLGYMAPLYVVEVKVAALHPNLRTPEISKCLAQLMKDQLSPLVQLSWPAFTSEDGNLFCKVLNCLVKYTKEEIEKFNLIQTEDFVRTELSNMEAYCDDARIQKLQSLMPDGIVVSKAYLQSILDHVVTADIPKTTPLENAEEINVTTEDTEAGINLSEEIKVVAPSGSVLEETAVTLPCQSSTSDVDQLQQNQVKFITNGVANVAVLEGDSSEKLADDDSSLP